MQWISGKEDDGKDSIAQQIAPKDHWPELRAIILVVGFIVLDLYSFKNIIYIF